MEVTVTIPDGVTLLDLCALIQEQGSEGRKGSEGRLKGSEGRKGSEGPSQSVLAVLESPSSESQVRLLRPSDLALQNLDFVRRISGTKKSPVDRYLFRQLTATSTIPANSIIILFGSPGEKLCRKFNRVLVHHQGQIYSYQPLEKVRVTQNIQYV